MSEAGTGSADTNTAGAGPGSTEGQNSGEGAGAPAAGQPAAGDTNAKGEGGEGSKAQAGDDFEFTAPEGIELDQKSVDAFKSILKDKTLDDKSRAQKIVDLAAQREQARVDAHKTMVEGWAEQVKTGMGEDGKPLPEHLKVPGGDKLPETLAIAKKVLDLGPPELKGLLNATGMGNHPAIVRWAYDLGKKLSEDTFVPGGKEVPSQTSQADRLYPKTAQAKQAA